MDPLKGKFPLMGIRNRDVEKGRGSAKDLTKGTVPLSAIRDAA